MRILLQTMNQPDNKIVALGSANGLMIATNNKGNNSVRKFNHQAIICLHVRSMAFSINKALIYFTFLW